MKDLSVCLVNIRGFKFYVLLSGFFRRKLTLFALHFVRPFPHESLIYYYDFVDKKAEVVRA